uniref:Secreted protein n=1 Tax=Piliocolobus tephrosceles TaxID=591936 RepID=A0A8C9INL0_9PRIM
MVWVLYLFFLSLRGFVSPTLEGQANVGRSQGSRVINILFFGKWGTWHQGPITRKHQNPCRHTHSILPRDLKWATAVAVGPAQAGSASLLSLQWALALLPPAGSALISQPSTICSPRLLRGQPSLGHAVPHSQLPHR